APSAPDCTMGKVIVWGAHSQAAMARMRNALDAIVDDGIKTHVPLTHDLTRDEGFCQDGINIHDLEHTLANQ
ncbi:acetyl-CoA carboxylase biotin carboxylase subunit, partial [Pseudomonas syringae]